MRSMTGFGAAEATGHGLRLAVQISSVNRKHLDLRLNLPKDLSFAEKDVRETVAAKVFRGSVQVNVDITAADSSGRGICVDRDLARAYVQELRALRQELDLEGDPRLQDLLALPDLFTVIPPPQDPEAIGKLVVQTVATALADFAAMRDTEGEALRRDLEERFASLHATHAAIARLAPRIGEFYRRRLTDAIRELGQQVQVDDERVLKEVAIYAERADVTEELTRLSSHLAQARDLIEQDGPVGRKLDFLGQEMQREINTVGAKANDADIARHVVDFKAELDRVREQVQNVE